MAFAAQRNALTQNVGENDQQVVKEGKAAAPKTGQGLLQHGSKRRYATPSQALWNVSTHTYFPPPPVSYRNPLTDVSNAANVPVNRDAVFAGKVRILVKQRNFHKLRHCAEEHSMT